MATSLAKKAKKADSILTNIPRESKADEEDANIIIQFAKEVKDFSSQYGEENSESYTARNLAGNANVFPSYEDSYKACALRTYGSWWKKAPSARKTFERTPKTLLSDDYIEITFATKVYPVKLDIYETYNPGAIIRILACEMIHGTDVDSGLEMCEWVILWQGRPEKSTRQSRIFSPPLRQCPFPTDLLRLELCHDLVPYYTQLDCVRLHGTHKYRASDSSVKRELIQGIHSELDLSRFLSKETCSIHCTELNLQPYWRQVTVTTMKGLKQFSHLQRLNLSWCKNPLLTINGVNEFLQFSGRQLTCLYMSTCKFVNDDCLMSVAKNCPNLRELDIDNCVAVDSTGFSPLKNLTQLQRLNLYRTCIDKESLTEIIRSCHDLQHLNLGSCIWLHSMDDIAYELGKNCRILKSLDLWRSKSISHKGLGYISVNCPDLEEIDLGWCPELKSTTLCFVELAKSCTKLKKLFLTGNVTVSDGDVMTIAMHCKEMEQLDIVGTSEVSALVARCILTNCAKLILFDVSNCPDIDFSQVERWQKDFPHYAGLLFSLQLHLQQP